MTEAPGGFLELGGRLPEIGRGCRRIRGRKSFPEAELAPGTAVFAGRWDDGRIVGRVTGLEDDRVELAYDWNGVTVTSPMDAVIVLPAGEGSLALRWVGYRLQAQGVWFKGLCFAESGEQLWISADGGHVDVVARDAVKPLLADLGRVELAAGDAVTACSWGAGLPSRRRRGGARARAALCRQADGRGDLADVLRQPDDGSAVEPAELAGPDSQMIRRPDGQDDLSHPCRGAPTLPGPVPETHRPPVGRRRRLASHSA